MKAVLVIDKAESCTGCLLGIYNKKWFCLATNKDIDICDRYNIPTWCPLRPLPSKLVPFGYLDAGNEDGLYEKVITIALMKSQEKQNELER